jgi:transglutaminase/protease-like cytokinesis protein 3
VQNDYTNLDRYAATLNYNGTSTSELASLLSQYARTDIEKARIIYAWIAYHIAYDVESFFNGKYKYNSISPKTVLTTRKTVCSGYAELYKALATKMKLEVVIIEGYAKGYSYIPGAEFTVNHAWNAVKIDGGWYLLDSTWGTGSVNNSHQFVPNFNSHYFATAPEQFIYDHFPVDSAWQLLPNPYSKKQFEDLPKLLSRVE